MANNMLFVQLNLDAFAEKLKRLHDERENLLQKRCLVVPSVSKGHSQSDVDTDTYLEMIGVSVDELGTVV